MRFNVQPSRSLKAISPNTDFPDGFEIPKDEVQAMSSPKTMALFKVRQLKELFEKHSLKEELSAEEWDSFKDEALSSKTVNRDSFESLMMMHLRYEKRYRLGRSLMDFIRSKGPPSVMTLSNYISLCGQSTDECSESEVFSLVNELHPDSLMNMQIAEVVASGITRTSQWKIGVKMIRDARFPSSILYAEVIGAAFRNGDYDTAWNLLDEMVEKELDVYDAVYEECLSSLEKGKSNLSKTKEMLTKLLYFCRSNRVLLSTGCATKLKSLLEDVFSFEGNFVTVQNDMCHICHKPLERINLKPEELNRLQAAVQSQVMLGSDVFQHSTPSEVSEFVNFIKNIRSYDLVIDGLNVAFMNSKINNNNAERCNTLLKVIKSFPQKKILMIGRKHMLKWSKGTMTNIRKQAACFFAENISKDDPFFLYAALTAGPESFFVTRDLLRDHRFKLPDKETRDLFDRWRISRQIIFAGINHHGKCNFIYPLKQDIRIQGDWENGWHVPYHDDSRELGPYDHCTSWICFSR